MHVLGLLLGADLHLLPLSNDASNFILKHLIRQLKAFNAFELAVQLFALHQVGIVSEHPAVHFLLSELKAIRMRYLSTVAYHGNRLEVVFHVVP